MTALSFYMDWLSLCKPVVPWGEWGGHRCSLTSAEVLGYSPPAFTAPPTFAVTANAPQQQDVGEIQGFRTIQPGEADCTGVEGLVLQANTLYICVRKPIKLCFKTS